MNDLSPSVYGLRIVGYIGVFKTEELPRIVVPIFIDSDKSIFYIPTDKFDNFSRDRLTAIANHDFVEMLRKFEISIILPCIDAYPNRLLFLDTKSRLHYDYIDVVMANLKSISQRLYIIAKDLVKLNRYTEALAMLNQAHNADKNNIDIVLMIVGIHMYLKDEYQVELAIEKVDYVVEERLKEIYKNCFERER